MVFKFLGKNKEEEIDRSIKKYKKFIHDDLNTGISLMFNKKVYEPEIEKLENRHITFRLTGKNKSILKYKIGQVIEVEFINAKNGLYFTTIKITDKTVESNNIYYTGYIVSPIEKKQRRDSFRLSTHIKVTYVLLPEKLRSYNGIAKDISCGGMQMESDQFVSKGKKIQLFFEVDKHRYKVNALVTGNEYDDLNEKNIHHIKFEEISRKEKKLLQDYILDEQRRRIRSGSGRI